MTAQFREVITIDGQIYGMETEPLDLLIIKEFNGQKKVSHDGYPTLYPSSTACWRGYIGYWLIDDNQLWLKDVRGPNEDDGGKIYVEVAQDQLKLLDWRKTLFDNQKGNIKAEWFTGELVIEMGKLIEYVHMGYSSQYEKYMIIEINNGNVINKTTLSNQEYFSKKY